MQLSHVHHSLIIARNNKNTKHHYTRRTDIWTTILEQITEALSVIVKSCLFSQYVVSKHVKQIVIGLIKLTLVISFSVAVMNQQSASFCKKNISVCLWTDCWHMLGTNVNVWLQAEKEPTRHKLSTDAITVDVSSPQLCQCSPWQTNIWL